MRRRSHFFSNLVYYTTTVKINPQKFIKYLEKKGKLNRVIIDLSGQITYNKNYILGEFRESYTEDTMDNLFNNGNNNQNGGNNNQNNNKRENEIVNDISNNTIKNNVKGNNQTTNISVNEISKNQTDSTTATKKMPQTGGISTFILIAIISAVAIVCYIKYRSIQIK